MINDSSPPYRKGSARYGLYSFSRDCPVPPFLRAHHTRPRHKKIMPSITRVRNIFLGFNQIWVGWEMILGVRDGVDAVLACTKAATLHIPSLYQSLARRSTLFPLHQPSRISTQCRSSTIRYIPLSQSIISLTCFFCIPQRRFAIYMAASNKRHRPALQTLVDPAEIP